MAAFDDEFGELGEESEGEMDDPNGLFDDLAAGKKQTVLEDFGDNSRTDIPSLPRDRKESSQEDGESEDLGLTEDEQAKMIEDQFMLIYMQDEQL